MFTREWWRWFRRFSIMAAVLAFPALAAVAAPPAPEQTDVFVSGTDGYHTFRIPAVIAPTTGTLLAFCEGRKDGRGDSGNIDLVLKRSADNGKTWNKMLVVADEGADTIGNPCPVVDRTTGTVWLLLTKNVGSDTQKL